MTTDNLVYTADTVNPPGGQRLLAPSADPSDPGTGPYGMGSADWWLVDQMLSRRDEPWVDENSALTYLPFWACVRVISQTLGCLGWHVYERLAGGRGKRPIEDDVSWLLGVQASEELSALEWRQVSVKDALVSGNAFSEIERTATGQPAWLHRIPPDRVTLIRDDDGRLLYRVDNGGGDYSWLTPREVFHLRNLSPDGLVGWSNVALARRALSVGMSIEQYKASFFARGPMPGGILEIPQRLSEADREEARKSFQKVYGGARKAGRVVVVFGGMKFTAADLPNDDAQLLDSGRFSAEEICRLFGVPPHKIGILDRSTNNNIEHQGIEFVQDCILPWARRMEAEADVKLFGRTNRGRRFTQLNLGTLLRGDSTTQMDNVTKGVTNGVYLVNEGREYLGLNPIDGGDTPIVQGAMVRLDDVLNPPEPPPPPQPPGPPQDDDGGEDDPNPDEGPPDALAALRPVFEDACRRLLRQEANRARAALKSNNVELASLLGKLEQSHPAFVMDMLRPAAASLCTLIRRKDAELEADLDFLASGHMAWLSERLTRAAADPSVCDGWEGRASMMAEKVMDLLNREVANHAEGNG
jgi:HK97 family phage portal protein